MTNKQAAIHIIRTLHRNGFQALLAGGCVRDMLMSRQAKDYDVATDALPPQVSEIFSRTIQVGAQFGVVIVLIDSQQVEVATFRTEADYTDGRHPSTVSFSSPKEDAARRDFTINGMFFDPLKEQVIDFVNGREDLQKKIIRTIGLPLERFNEDYLRILRAVRFSTQLNFTIEDNTWRSVCELSNRITNISGERISVELQGILCDINRTRGIKLLQDSKLLEHIFDGFTADRAGFAAKVLKYLPDQVDYGLAIAALFSKFETAEALNKLQVLMLSNDHKKQIAFLLDNRGKLLDWDMKLAELKKILANPFYNQLFELQLAILKADELSLDPLHKFRKRSEKLKGIDLQPEPLVNGSDLIEVGFSPGPFLGQVLNEVYDLQLEEKISQKNQALEYAKKRLNYQKIE